MTLNVPFVSRKMSVTCWFWCNLRLCSHLSTPVETSFTLLLWPKDLGCLQSTLVCLLSGIRLTLYSLPSYAYFRHISGMSNHLKCEDFAILRNSFCSDSEIWDDFRVPWSPKWYQNVWQNLCKTFQPTHISDTQHRGTPVKPLTHLIASKTFYWRLVVPLCSLLSGIPSVDKEDP